MVQSNTILSSTSSLFTFLMSLRFLQEKFTWVKLWSILLCMTGTIVVSFSDSEEGSSVATNPIWGDLLCVASAIFYAAYTTLIRKKLPDEAQGEEEASTALFFGFLGLFNGLFLLPVALILHFTGVETFHRLTALQYGLIIGKGLTHFHCFSYQKYWLFILLKYFVYTFFVQFLVIHCWFSSEENPVHIINHVCMCKYNLRKGVD